MVLPVLSRVMDCGAEMAPTGVFEKASELCEGVTATRGALFAGDPGRELQVYRSLQDYIYLSAAVYLFVKIGLIALILYTALYLKGMPIDYNKIFRLVVRCEFIFLLPAALKIVMFPEMYPDGNINDWHHYYVLSALDFFPNASADWTYALQTLNLFEVAYWFLLGFGLYRITSQTYDQALRLVVISYLPVLGCWVASVTLFMVEMFPATG